jgi:hypothetical protein
MTVALEGTAGVRTLSHLMLERTSVMLNHMHRMTITLRGCIHLLGVSAMLQACVSFLPEATLQHNRSLGTSLQGSMPELFPRQHSRSGMTYLTSNRAQ